MGDRIVDEHEVEAPGALGMGFVTLDYVKGTGGDFASSGGSCGNVMAILAWLGWRAAPIARLGADKVGDWVRSDLKRLGVVADYLSCEENVSTPVVVQRFVSGSQGQRSHSFLTSCPDCGRWFPRYQSPTIPQAEAAWKSFGPAQVFYFDRVSPAAVRLARRAREQGALVMFEPSSRGDSRLFDQALEVCHVLKFSTERFGEAVGLTCAPKPDVIVQTFGKAGLRARWHGKWIQLPAVPAPSFRDAAGSGDWCSAALLYGIAGRGSSGLATVSAAEFAEVLRVGQTFAAMNCSYEGARGLMSETTPDELSEASGFLGLSGVELPSRHGTTPGIGQTYVEYCNYCLGKSEACQSDARKHKQTPLKHHTVAHLLLTLRHRLTGGRYVSRLEFISYE